MGGEGARRLRQEGMALLMVLWTIGVLALISAVVTTTNRTETNRARNLLEGAKAEGRADAGIYQAIAALLETDPAKRPLVDGTVYQWRFGDSDVLISIQSEAGKIDLNSASDQLLQGLFSSVDVEPTQVNQLVDAIRDFSDRDDSRRAHGAEDSDYSMAGLVSGAKDGQFESVAELQQVMGMTPELYDRVAPVMTVYSGARSIDSTVAPRAALLALPEATRAKVDDILATRAGAVSDEVSMALRSVSDAEAAAEAEAEAEAEAAEVRSAAMEMQTIEASTNDAKVITSIQADRRRYAVVTITATAHTPGGGGFERVAVVRLRSGSTDPFTFHVWRQGWASTNLKDDGASGNKP